MTSRDTGGNQLVTRAPVVAEFAVNIPEESVHTFDPVVEKSVIGRLLVDLSESADSVEIDISRAASFLQLIESVLDGGECPDLSGLPTSDLLLVNELVRGLRSRMLTAGDDDAVPPPAEQILGMLVRLEAVQDELRRGAGERGVLSLLSSLRGPELMVELAHDLRSPLTSILFLAEALRNGHSGAVNQVQHRQLGIMYGAALSMVAMVGDVIEVSRGGSSLVENPPTAFAISHSFESISDLVRPMLEQKGIELRLRPIDRDHRLGLPLALNRVLLNLTTNAIKFTDQGYVELSAHDLGDDRVEFSVRDTGMGIDEAEHNRLFQAIRTDPVRHTLRFSGSGLGLSICRRLVAAMGGELEFETRSGWGTRFFFSVHVPPVVHG